MAPTPAGQPDADAAAPSPAGRLVWADAAKGLSIVLVVLHHLAQKHYGVVVPDGLEWLAQGWQALTSVLKPVRMPLFFLISGMFAAAALRRPWHRVRGPRALTPYYLYVVWVCVHAVVFARATALPMNRTRDAADLLRDMLFASTSLWYLYALAAYFVLAKLLVGWDRRVVVAAAALLAATAGLLPIEAYNRVSVLHHFVYFALGAYFPDVVRHLAVRRSALGLALLLAAYAGLAGLAGALGLPHRTTVLATSVAAVPLTLSLVVAASHAWPRVGLGAAAVGRRSLEVYVLHMPVLAGLHHLLAESVSVPDRAWPSAAVAAVPVAAYPLVATAALTAACLLLRAGAVGPLRWLFVLPGRRRLPHTAEAATRAADRR